MKSLYAKYINEREGREIVEKENGFATYQIFAESKLCYLADVYVERDHRKTGLASQMADEVSEIAKAKGCENLMTSVDTAVGDPTASIAVVLAYGFNFNSVDGKMLYFSRRL